MKDMTTMVVTIYWVYPMVRLLSSEGTIEGEGSNDINTEISWLRNLIIATTSSERHGTDGNAVGTIVQGGVVGW